MSVSGANVQFTIVKGPMGCGKSMYGAEEIVKYLAAGAHVMTNMPLRMDEIMLLSRAGDVWEDRVILLPEDASKIVELVPQPPNADGSPRRPVLRSSLLVAGTEECPNLLVIDEASLQFDIDDQMTDRKKNKPIFQLVALCRHMGINMMFLAQSEKNVDAKLRRMAETQILCVNVAKIKIWGWLMVKAPFFGDFLRIYFNRDELMPTAKTWHKFDPVAASIYDTHGMRDGVEMKVAVSAFKPVDETQRKGKIMAVATLCVLVGVFGYALISGGLFVKRINDKYVNPSEQKEPVKAVAVEAAKFPGKGVVREVEAENSHVNMSVAAVVNPNHRKGKWFEWDTSDEYVFGGSTNDGRGLLCRSIDGLLIGVGQFYQGEKVVSYVPYGGYHYFTTDSDRVVVLRPLTAKERTERIEKLQVKKANQGPLSGLLQTGATIFK